MIVPSGRIFASASFGKYKTLGVKFIEKASLCSNAAAGASQTFNPSMIIYEASANSLL